MKKYTTEENNIFFEEIMHYITSSKNRNTKFGIKYFKEISSRRKRRCRNYQTSFYTCETTKLTYVRVPCIDYSYKY